MKWTFADHTHLNKGNFFVVHPHVKYETSRKSTKKKVK